MPIQAITDPNQGFVPPPEVDRLLSDLRGVIQKLLQDRDSLGLQIQQLEQERDALRQTVTTLQEKCATYAPLISHWAKGVITPEEAEAIVQKNDWVNFEEVMEELNKVK